MGRPVVHFEIIGHDPATLRGYYGELFGWEFDTSGEVSDAVSVPTDYGFTDNTSPDGAGIPGGVGGGTNYPSKTVFYVHVADVEEALQQAERLGGTRVLGPASAPSGLVVGQLTDPEGNLIGLAALP
jgi:predicted enzyme related to lactoylglutathione lyase